jgi:hypothetical protein
MPTMRYILVQVDQAVTGDSTDYYVVVDTDSTPTVIARCLDISHAAAIRDALNATV